MSARSVVFMRETMVMMFVQGVSVDDAVGAMVQWFVTVVNLVCKTVEMLCICKR